MITWWIDRTPRAKSFSYLRPNRCMGLGAMRHYIPRSEIVYVPGSVSDTKAFGTKFRLSVINRNTRGKCGIDTEHAEPPGQKSARQLASASMWGSSRFKKQRKTTRLELLAISVCVQDAGRRCDGALGLSIIPCGFPWRMNGL